MKPTQFALLASFFWVLTTHAATVRDLEFGTNGVLPSTDPDIEPFISPSLSETNVFSVTNGVLQQRTFGVAGSGTYQWPDAGFFFGTLDPALDFAMEARLRVLRIEGIGGAFFQAFNDVHQYAAFFTASGVQIRTNGGGFAFIPIDLTNLHTYRLEGLGNSDVMRLLVDGTNSFEGLAPAVSDFNGFSWGDDASGTGNGADVDWDYLRVSQLDPRTDCVQPPDSLVSLWKGEGNGNDTWSTNHGTLQNGAGFAPGRVGQAFSFDGVAGYVRIPVQPALLLDHFSIAAWVKPNALVDDPSGEEVLFAQDDGRPQLVVRTGTSGMKVAIQFRASTNYPDCVSRSEIPIGNFSHVAGTWDGLTLRLFINGLLDNEVVANDAPTNTMRDFFIGGINDPPVYVGQFFNGLIDESALFRSAIPSNEIAVLYAAGSAGMCGPGQVPTVAVDLQSGSDTGASNTDNLTSDTTPSFDITINRPGDIQFFYSGGTNADEVRTNLDAGTFAFTTPSLSDGVHTVTARFVPFSGNPVQASLAVTIDTRGPRVVASTLPAGATLNDTLDGVEVTFDSAIDPASLTVADVTLSGPGGSIAITSIAPLSSNQFLISFPVQRADGEYDVTLGPNVADLAGNLMDQDGDGINGESPQDVFIVHFTLSLPDLAVTQVNVPLIAPAGQLVPIIWTMTNSGRATAIAPWNNTVVLANDATGNGSQTLASVPATISLVPGSSLTQTSTVLLPADMFGQKYVLVTVNSGGQVPETDESNNTLAAAQPIQILGPDLVVESVAIHPPSPHFGDAVDLVWTVRNVGTGPALNPWSDRLQLSTDTIVGGDTLLLTLSADDVVPLAAGAAYTRTQSVTLPLGPTLPSGTYFLLAESDIAAQLPELNEFNNFRFSDPISISQPPLPDLMVADILSPTNGFAGHPVTVSWVITNQGAATAIGPWADTILLATNSQGGNAVPLATFNYSTNLAAGASLTRGGAVLLPAEFFGELFFVVQTDSSNQVYESTETNNLAVASIRIHIQASDLIVTDLQAPGDTLTDRSFEVTWTVENHSEAPAAGSWLDQVYLRFPGPSGTNLLLGTFPFNDGLASRQHSTHTPRDQWRLPHCRGDRCGKQPARRSQRNEQHARGGPVHSRHPQPAPRPRRGFHRCGDHCLRRPNTHGSLDRPQRGAS